MQAYEFEADVVDNIIKIPHEYTGLFNKHIKIIALLDETPFVKTVTKPATLDNFLTDEFISANWQKLIITSSATPAQDDDMVLQDEYGDYLNAKHSA